MAFPIPKIVYGSTTLTFTNPPVNKTPINDRQAQRTDTFSISGLKQSVFWRSDQFLVLQMTWIPEADVPAWEDFLAYAEQGKEFSYYKDATLSGFTVFTLEDTKMSLQRNIAGVYQITLNFRKVTGADQTGS